MDDAEADEIFVRGSFVKFDGTPISGAAVHYRFLGDPPTNCGTSFDLHEAPAHTDDSGQFTLKLSRLDYVLSRQGEKAGAWRQGCYAILAAKDSRMIGYSIASGIELNAAPVQLSAIPLADITGQVVDEVGSPVASARIVVERYMFFVGRGPYPSAPVNFWLSRRTPEKPTSRQPVADLASNSDEGGNFTIRNVPAMPGRLDLAISHVDFATLETQYFPFQPPVRMTLQPAATVRICLTLPDGQPAPGFKLILEGIPNGAHSSICRSGDTDNAGICTFTGLPVGNHTIRYHGGAAEPLAVPAIRIAGLGKGEFREIARQAVPGCIICGRVLNADSKLPVEHAEVRFQNREYPRTASTFQAAYTNTNGSFEFRYAVAPGVYDIAVTTTYQGERIGHGYSLNVERQPRIDQTFFLELPAVRTSDS